MFSPKKYQKPSKKVQQRRIVLKIEMKVWRQVSTQDLLVLTYKGWNVRFMHSSLPPVTLDCYVIDGLPSILELLRVLVNVLDPNDQQHTDSTRLIALRTLNAAFEESGYYIPQYPSLKALIVDHGCKYMFQLARSDNIWVLQAALRAISTMFETMRKHLKLQQELFLAFAIDRLAQPSMLQLGKGQVSTVQGKKSSFTASPRPGTPALPSTNAAPEVEAETDKGIALSSRVLVAPARGESRDLLLETLIHISRYPSFMIDLYINYDCDVNCENLFERLIDFLTKVSHRYMFTLVLFKQTLS